MGESAPSAAPAAAPSGPSPMPQVSDAGPKPSSRSGKGLIDQASQQSLSEKLSGSAPKPPSPAPPAATADATEPVPTPPPPAPPKYKVKIDGKEQEVTLEEMQKDYQLRTVAQKRMQEAQELKKKIDSVLGIIQSNTGDALRAAGLTDEQIEAFAVDLIAKRQRAFLEQEKLKNASPEEKELARLRKLEAEYRDYAQKVEEQRRTHEFESVKAGLSALVIDTLEALPKEYRRNDFVASRALDAWQYAYENQAALREKGIQITPQSVAKALRAEIEGLGKTLAQAAKEAAAGGEPLPAEVKSPAQPGKPVSRAKSDKEAKPEKEPLTQAQLMRQIVLGQR